MFFSKLDEFGAREQIPLAPRGNHLDVRLQSIIGQLKTHLVVALARGAVAHSISARGAGNLNLTLGNQRAGNGGAEQINPFIQGVGAEHGEHIVAHKFFAQIINVDFLDA